MFVGMGISAFAAKRSAVGTVRNETTMEDGGHHCETQNLEELRPSFEEGRTAKNRKKQKLAQIQGKEPNNKEQVVDTSTKRPSARGQAIGAERSSNGHRHSRSEARKHRTLTPPLSTETIPLARSESRLIGPSRDGYTSTSADSTRNVPDNGFTNGLWKFIPCLDSYRELGNSVDVILSSGDVRYALRRARELALTLFPRRSRLLGSMTSGSSVGVYVFWGLQYTEVLACTECLRRGPMHCLASSICEIPMVRKTR